MQMGNRGGVTKTTQIVSQLKGQNKEVCPQATVNSSSIIGMNYVKLQQTRWPRCTFLLFKIITHTHTHHFCKLVCASVDHDAGALAHP